MYCTRQVEIRDMKLHKVLTAWLACVRRGSLVGAVTKLCMTGRAVLHVRVEGSWNNACWCAYIFGLRCANRAAGKAQAVLGAFAFVESLGYGVIEIYPGGFVSTPRHATSYCLYSS